jgi:hypothetical protein
VFYELRVYPWLTTASMHLKTEVGVPPRLQNDSWSVKLSITAETFSPRHDATDLHKTATISLLALLVGLLSFSHSAPEPEV